MAVPAQGHLAPAVHRGVAGAGMRAGPIEARSRSRPVLWVSSPFKNAFSRSSRVTRLTLAGRNVGQSEPPYVGCYFFNGLLGVRVVAPVLRGGLVREDLVVRHVVPIDAVTRNYRNDRRVHA